MHTLEVVTVFFGWMTAINFVFLFVASIMVMTMRGGCPGYIAECLEWKLPTYPVCIFSASDNTKLRSSYSA